MKKIDALLISFCKTSYHGISAIRRNKAMISGIFGHAHIALFAPIFSPRVSYDPISSISTIRTITDNCNCMIHIVNT